MTRTRNLASTVISAVAGGALVMMAVVVPAGAAAAAAVPIDLYAVAGSTTLPAGGQSVTVWGYSTTNAAVTAPGGPTLVVDQGDTVDITLYNELTEPTALYVGGQVMVPDRTGVAPAGSKTYSFTADLPGTYLYEAGPVPNAEHQVAMGLYGALIVRPATAGQAYDAASTAYDDEAVLVLSEIDPALNNRADPATFDMRNYAPRYFLVNGKAYPDTDAIATQAGHTVLLRYVNAGSLYHSMAVLGADQSVIALDGNPLTYAHDYVAETFGPGQTADALVLAPNSSDDATVPVYDGSLLLHNSNLAGAGGMVTFLAVTGSGAPADPIGPVTSAVALSAGGTLSATATALTPGAVVAAAEYYVDSTAGTPVPMTATDGAFDSATEAVEAAVTVPAGNHALYVRGQDDGGVWGAFSSVLVNGGDAGGPTTSAAAVQPSPTNGTVSVSVTATADDSASGGSTIAAAEYFVDAVGADGTGAAMTVSGSGSVASLTASIPAADVAALGEGSHTVSIHAQDSGGSWGAVATVPLVIDVTGPVSQNLAVAPSPNNGTLAYNGGTPVVRVSAGTLEDVPNAGVNSTVGAAEIFLDTLGADGTGIVMSASDGRFDSATEAGYADIPLSTVVLLSEGSHPVYVHAKDSAGNWGAAATTELVVDKTRPTLDSVSASPNPTQGARTVTLTAAASDSASAISRVEWFVGTDPGAGNGTAMTLSGTGPTTATGSIDVSSRPEGSFVVTVRARDAAGNWSTTSTVTVAVTAPLWFSTVGATNPPGVGGSADAADVYRWDGSGFSRVWDASVAGL
ncbi:multicopper oxidase domain-containing protein, partial [Actinotalea sp. M2MS4P-6]|uniref:multicopper oxidase domain-containing protein n=1 Tax=Actinotalea sp. M2MS4P-6 TaxID=2983762 RepID=UPI0021E4ED11